MRTLGSTSLSIMARAEGRYELSDGYLCEIGNQPSPDWLVDEAGLIRDVLWLRETLGENGISTIQSHAHLQRLHDRLVGRVGRMDLKCLPAYPLPGPPFPESSTGLLHVEPMTTESDLIHEGRSQSNCVGAYAKRIRHGGLYVYSLLTPERATLALTRARNGSWRITKLKASGNAQVAAGTRKEVEARLETLSPRAGRQPKRPS